jgi:hypothetical protein
MAHLTRQQQEGFRIRHRSGCVSDAMESGAAEWALLYVFSSW